MAIKISGSTIIDDSRVLVNTGNVGVGTTNPDTAVDPGNTNIVHAGIVTANFLYGDGSNLSNLPSSGIATEASFLKQDADGNILAGDATTGGGYNPATGTACFNIFMGSNAGNSITTGDYNFFAGQAAGACNTEGCNNIFIGALAGYRNTTGFNNNFFGLVQDAIIPLVFAITSLVLVQDAIIPLVLLITFSVLLQDSITPLEILILLLVIGQDSQTPLDLIIL